jgi:hypothetical protein
MNYRWETTSKYAGYLGKAEADERKMRWYDTLMGDPLPDLGRWVPPNLEQYLPGKAKPKVIGDSPASALVNLISQKAAAELSEFFRGHAELYPVKLMDSEENYFMVVAKQYPDVLDRSKSSGMESSFKPGLFCLVERWVFFEDRVKELDVFAIPDCPTTIYVSERFKQRVIASKLKGFCFKTFFEEQKPFIS